MVGEVAPVLFAGQLMKLLNGQDTWHLLQFSDGSVFNTRTCTVEPGRPVLYISLTTGYPYPAAEIRAIQGRLAARGLNLQDILEEVKAFEAQLDDEYNCLPEGITQKLDSVAATEGMELRESEVIVVESDNNNNKRDNTQFNNLS